MQKPKKKQSGKFNKGIVTFLDVLGWKGLWQSNKEAVTQLRDIVSFTRKRAKEIVRTYNEKERAKDVRYKDISIKVLSISDTIVFLKDTEDRMALAFHAQLCSWLLKYAISKRIPLRGAISYGEFTESENIMLGPAIDEAAAWHESTDWIGVILTPSARMYVRNEKIPYIIDNYDNIPFKKANKTLKHCVDWSIRIEDGLYDIFLEKGPHMPEVAPKYLNTLEFLKWRKKRDKASEIKTNTAARLRGRRRGKMINIQETLLV